MIFLFKENYFFVILFVERTWQRQMQQVWKKGGDNRNVNSTVAFHIRDCTRSLFAFCILLTNNAAICGTLLHAWTLTVWGDKPIPLPVRESTPVKGWALTIEPVNSVSESPYAQASTSYKTNSSSVVWVTFIFVASTLL